MGRRLLLHAELLAILGSPNVYYQPPATIIMSYPAIVYSRDTIGNRFANDKVYTTSIAYEIIVIDRNPDSILIEKVAAMPSCRFVRNYTVENLNHDAFVIQY